VLAKPHGTATAAVNIIHGIKRVGDKLVCPSSGKISVTQNDISL